MSNRDFVQTILDQTEQVIASSAFRSFVAQSHSRHVLQRMRADPSDWPIYSPTLTTNLLYVAHYLLSQGLQLRDIAETYDKANQYIRQGAEILEFVYAEMETNPGERLEQLFSAALGYYIAGYYARAYVLIRDIGIADNLLPEYELLRLLFLKQLELLHNKWPVG